MICREMYRKKTAFNTILPFNSQHLKHTLKSIPVGELTRVNGTVVPDRLMKICICHSLKARGYPDTVLQRAKRIVDNKTRDNLLSVKCGKGTIDSRPILVLDYNNQHTAIKNIVAKYIPILSEDETVGEILRNGYRVITKKSKSLGNMISPSLFCSKNSQPTWLSCKGFFRCGKMRCRSCTFAVETKEFDNGDHTMTYPIKQFINCDSTYVIYAIHCSICHKSYIGSTIRKLKVRILEHLNDIVAITSRNVSGGVKAFY